MANNVKNSVFWRFRTIFNRLMARIAPQHYTAGFWNDLAQSDPYQAILTGVDDNQEFLKSGRCSMGYLENHIILEKTWHVLDYGCGTGRVTRFIAPKTRKVTAADISRTMLDHLKHETGEIERISPVLIRSRTLKELPDNEYDLVFSMLVLQHMNKDKAAKTLQHLSRKLKNNGYIFLQFPSADYKVKFQELYTTKSETDASEPGLARLYSPLEIEKLLHENSLSPLKIEYRDHDYYVSAMKMRDRNRLKPLPPLFEESYSAEISVLAGESDWPAGQQRNLTCRLRNTGNMAWRNDEVDLINYVQLGISLADREEKVLTRDYARQGLPYVVQPGAEIEVTITCPSVADKGPFVLLIDMVNERHFWFRDRTGTVTRHRIVVR